MIAPTAPAAVAGYTVTSTGDEGDAAARANCSSGTGPCTLRAAILEANAHPNDPSGPDQIRFAIDGSPTHIIAVTSSLPAITDPVAVDAGLPPANAPRQVELTGSGCLLTTSLPCEGLVIAADSTTVRGLAINGFFSSIRAQPPSGQELTDLVIEGNYLGTNAAGSSLKPHPALDLDVGLQLFHVARSRIGGDPARGEGNVIAGFHAHQIDGAFVSTTRFLGNRIGTNPSGTASLGGGGNGIHLVAGGDNVFGEPGAGNVISGLSGPSRTGGLHSGLILLDTQDNVIQSNRVGTNAAGNAVVANTGIGIEVQAVRTVIGGSPAAGNVVSGNVAGISMATSPNALGTGTPAANEVSFNRIGTDASGEVDLGNFSRGVGVHGDDSRIHHNVIAGNGTADERANGITLFLGSPNSVVENNWIGVSASGRPMGNTGFGVAVSDDPFVGGGSIIGGNSATGNHIAFNGLAGVVIGGSRFEEAGNQPGNTVRGNSIHDNGDPSPAVGLGIDLHTAGHNSGPDPIDPLDSDTGANEQQNAPEVDGITVVDGRTVVTGQLHSTPGQAFILDLYANSECDATGYGEGERWLKSVTVTTADLDDAEPGTTTFVVTLDDLLHSPQAVAATATNTNGSTSEFSACETAPTPPSRTRTTYTGPTVFTYSDPATMSGKLQDVSRSTPVGVAGKELEFSLGDMPAVHGAPTAADGAVSTAPTAVTLTPGSATIVTAFAGDAAYDASSDLDPVEVRHEDCTLTYTGDTLIDPLAQTRLAAQFGENDASHGTWTGKPIAFEVTDTSLQTRTYTAATNQAGTATVTVPLNADVYAVTARFAGDAFYTRCATGIETLVTVAAAGSKVTGGGWFSNTAGRTNFGFNAIPQTDGTYKGQLQVRPTTQKTTFHGTTVTGLKSLSKTSTQWTGTGQWNGTPGYTFAVTVVDNGSSGSKKADTIDLAIYPTGAPSTRVFTSSGAQQLRGGNVTVH